MERLINLKLVVSESRIEVYKYNNYEIRTDYSNTKDKTVYNKSIKTKKECDHESFKGTNKSRKDSLNRSRNNIKRLIYSNASKWKSFITLTFKDAPTYADGKKYLNRFLKKVKRNNKEFAYLYVMELGEKNKRLHFHMLTNLEFDIDKSMSKKGRKSNKHKEIENEFNDKYWNLGFLDIRMINDDIGKLSNYLCSYLTKDLLEIKDLHDINVFNHSRNLNKPLIVTLEDKQSLEQILSNFIESEYNINYTSSYPIGYTDWTGRRSGTVTYIELVKE